MRFRIRTLIFVTAATACILSWALVTGWFSIDGGERNLKIIEKLEQPVEMKSASWTVADLACYLKEKHEIPVTVSSSDASQALDDQTLSKIRLLNCMRLLLYPKGLSFAVRDGRLEIVGKDDPDAYAPGDVYSQGDLVPPRFAK